MAESNAPRLSLRDAAALLGVTPDTIRKAIKNGMLPAHQIGGRKDYRIVALDFEEWVAGGARTSPPKSPNDTEQE